MKKLENSAATLDPPDPAELLLGVPWLHGADTAEARKFPPFNNLVVLYVM